MNIMNKIGPNTKHLGTPLVTGNQEEDTPFKHNLCNLLLANQQSRNRLVQRLHIYPISITVFDVGLCRTPSQSLK